MNDNLDNKLRAIFGSWEKFTQDRAIAAIKEAFAIELKMKDSQWQLDNLYEYKGSGKAYTTDHKELMTGQAWFDRLEADIINASFLPNGQRNSDNVDFLEAARKAAGIDEGKE
jgi:hypothetical protein